MKNLISRKMCIYVMVMIFAMACFSACTRAQEIVTNFSHQRQDGSYVRDVIIRQ